MNGAFWKFWDRFGLATIILTGSLALAAAQPNFRTVDNLTNVINQAAIVAISGAGMTYAIAAGVFDLSVGSILAFAACIGASVVNRGGVAESVLAALAVGCGLGLANGLIVTKLRVPALIATLGTMAVIRGVVLLYTGGRDITIAAAKIDRYSVIGGGHLLGVPAPIMLMLFTYALLYVLLRHVPFGRHVCAVGSNAQAALSSGLNVDRILIGVFVLVGATAALSGVIQTSQIKGVSGATAGLTFELQAISVVVLGGTSLKGGRGRLFGTMLGAILVAVANNALNLYNTPAYYQRLVMGMILLLAVAIDGLRRGGPRHLGIEP
jgi:ribose transport system permease protein